MRKKSAATLIGILFLMAVLVGLALIIRNKPSFNVKEKVVSRVDSVVSPSTPRPATTVIIPEQGISMNSDSISVLTPNPEVGLNVATNKPLPKTGPEFGLVLGAAFVGLLFFAKSYFSHRKSLIKSLRTITIQ